MKISERFAEYGLTGAFFWLAQLFLLRLWLTDISAESWLTMMSQLNSFIAPVPPALQTSIAGLLGGLAIISIFVTGLLLDLFGSLLVLNEMDVFRKYLGHNRIWLTSVVKEYGGLTAKDFRALHYKLGAISRLIRPRRGVKRQPKSAAKRIRKLPRNFKLTFAELKFLGTYHRFQAFIFSFVLINSGASRLDILFDNHYLWRVSRTISTTIFILALELAAIVVAKSYASKTGVHGIYLIVYSLLLVSSLAMTVRAYSRMCATLFSLAQVTHNRLLSARRFDESKLQ